MQKQIIYIAAVAIIALAAIGYIVLQRNPAPLENTNVTSTDQTTVGTTTTPADKRPENTPGQKPPTAPPTSSVLGTIAGKVSIGPICGGAQQSETNPACIAGPTQYKQYTVTFSQNTATSEHLIRTATLNGDGSYSMQLLPGTYTVDINPHNTRGAGGVSGVPIVVYVAKGQTRIVNITIDTGIR